MFIKSLNLSLIISNPTKETINRFKNMKIKKTKPPKTNDQEEPQNKSHSNVKGKWAARNNV